MIGVCGHGDRPGEDGPPEGGGEDKMENDKVAEEKGKEEVKGRRYCKCNWVVT